MYHYLDDKESNKFKAFTCSTFPALYNLFYQKGHTFTYFYKEYLLNNILYKNILACKLNVMFLDIDYLN